MNPRHEEQQTKPEAITFIWKAMNRQARGKISATQALGAILHACMNALADRKPDEEHWPCGLCEADAKRRTETR